MGANKKFNRSAVTNQLRHVLREVDYPKNVDIDKTKSHLNYSLTPERKMSPKEYLYERLKEIHIFNKPGINLMSGWIITRPKEITDNSEKEFFEACYEFLKERYGGEKNVVSAEIHKDESGEPHMHFCFVPVTKYTPNENLVKVVNYIKEHPGENNTQVGAALGIDRKTVRRYRNCTEDDILYEKLSARDVINKEDLKTFHKDLQNYLNKRGIKANVNSGITKERGGNMTVDQLKMQREYLMEHGKDVDKILDNVNRVVDNVRREWDFD